MFIHICVLKKMFLSHYLDIPLSYFSITKQNKLKKTPTYVVRDQQQYSVLWVNNSFPLTVTVEWLKN